MSSIRRPGVDIEQEFVTESTTVTEPSLATVVIAPCFRVISAYDDDGEPLSDAYAGTYRDGNGTISYDFPSIGAEDSLTSLDDEIRVFLRVGSTDTELNSEGDESIITSGTGDYDQSAATFEDADTDFLTVGVEAGDVVRIAWRDVTYDLEISEVALHTLTVDDTLIPEDRTSVSFEVIRNPAQFVYVSQAQASLQLGEEVDFVTFTAVEGSAIEGSAGDGIPVIIAESDVYASGTKGFTGGTIFSSAAATFDTVIVDSAAGVPTTDTYLWVTAQTSLKQVLYVASETRILVEAGLNAGLSGQTYKVGTLVDSGVNGATGGGDQTAFTAAGQNFDTSIPSGAVPAAPTTVTYIEIEGVGVFTVTSVNSDTSLTISAGAGAGLSGKTFTIIERVEAHSDGATAATTQFVDPTATFLTTLDGDVAPATLMVVSGGTAYSVATVDSDVQLTLTDALASAAEITYEVVEEGAILNLALNDENALTITLNRSASTGASTTSLDDIVTALTDDGDASYSEAVSALFTAALDAGGATLASTVLGSYELDGGSDDNQLMLDADLIGSATPTGKVYVSYKALRVDMSAAAAAPALYSCESVTQLEADLSPVNTDNPLALGLYFALLNSPRTPVKGLGIGEVSAAKPNGTASSYSEALEFLEGQDVHLLVPLTQDSTVHSLFQTHVDAMSASTERAERICFINRELPAYATATTVASDTEGNTGADFADEGENDFTGSVDFEAAGVTAGDILVVSSLSEYHASLTPVTGTSGPLYGLVIAAVDGGDPYTLNVTVPADVSADWNSLVDVTFTVYRAGAAISSKTAQVAALEDVGEGFADRRVYFHWPDQVVADVDGSSTVLEGYYAACGWAGKAGATSASQGFSNTTISGFTAVKHSNGYFTDSQLNTLAGAGTWITIQEGASSPLKCRHQLSTDTSTVQKREFSITRTVDFVAKFFRQALSQKIGSFNITQAFLDGLAVQIQALGRYLVEAKILKTFDLSGIAPNDDSPDTVDITIVISPNYPCNYIAITLQL